MKFRIIDLSHTLHEGIPTWNGSCGWKEEIKLDYPQGLRVLNVKCHAGIGTHLDAPSHFVEGSWNAADIPLEQLIAPSCVLDVTENMSPDFLIEVEHLERFEKRHGPIEPNCFVLAHTGWSQFWNEPLRYRNPDAEGRLRFPGFSAEAADLLVQRNIAGIGIDTLSPDGSNRGFPVHEKILGAKKTIVENLTNLDALPPKGALFLALPLKSERGTESAIRAVALVSDSVNSFSL